MRREQFGPTPHLVRRKTALAIAAGLAFCAAVGATLWATDLVFGAKSMESRGKELATLPWGSGPGQVGLVQPTEGLTRGPEALAVSPDGRIAVLDSVNRRVVCLDAAGRYLLAAPVALAEPRFLAVDEQRLYVLDCDADRQLVTLDWQGGVLGTAKLPELPDVVTGLFATSQGACVEVAHDTTFLIPESLCDNTTLLAQTAGGTEPVPTASEQARARARTVSLKALPGRPIDHELARTVRAQFKPQTGLELTTVDLDKTTLGVRHERIMRPALALDQPLEHLISVDSDNCGGIIVGARLLNAGSAASGQPALALTRLAAAQLTERRSNAFKEVLLLSDCSVAYVGQPYVVAPDGRIFQPVALKDGYHILVHEFPPGSRGREQDLSQETALSQEVER
ncbi:MAG: hypothetical protein N3B14_09655 [Thermoleophilia bacterium]|nr:hypothetical protein [Thermoleophilia bacterium]